LELPHILNCKVNANMFDPDSQASFSFLGQNFIVNV
jgi:hypothetical protein